MKLSLILILLTSLFSQLAFAQQTNTNAEKEDKPFYNDKKRGWYYGEVPIKEEDQEDDLLEPPSSMPTTAAPLSPREILKKQGEMWEDAMATAILDPTLPNLQNYLAQTTQIQQQSEVFAEGFKQAIWITPEYDITLEKPVNTQAILAQSQVRNTQNSKNINEMANENGLIFFFRSDCPHCHRFAPILKRFAADFGFTIIPVSLDGGALPEFPYPKQNYDLGRKLKVEVVPALFMVNPESNTVVPVGYGYNDYSKLTQKVLFAGQQMDGSASISMRTGR